MRETGPLLERDEEVDALDDLLAAAREGRGGVAVVEGPAGVGKSRLLGDLAERAAGLRVLRARGAELERDFAYGVVRQLLEEPLMRAGDEERAALQAGAAGLALPVFESGVPAADEQATTHGLYWLLANLAESGPIAVVVDDAHWADAESLRWLLHLAPRVADLPVAVVVATRPPEPGAAVELIDALERDGETRVVPVPPLSAQASGELCAELLGRRDSELEAACHAATGGNPFLLRELVASIASDPERPTPDRVASLAPPSVVRATVARIRRLGDAAWALAAALAILGGEAWLNVVAQLAGLPEVGAGEAADALAQMGLVVAARPLSFVHPIVRTAVYESIPASERSAAHASAARLLTEAGHGPQVIAAHLLATEPAGSEQTVLALRAAARESLRRGAPGPAARYLRRALAEPPPAEARGPLLARLGAALLRAGEGDAAVEAYEEAHALSSGAVERAHVARGLARALLVAGQPERAVTVLSDAIAALPADERDLSLTLEADLQVTSYASPGAHAAAALRPAATPPHGPPERAGERLALAARALDTIFTTGPASLGADMARRALADGQLLAEESSDSPTFYLAANTLLDADELELAEAVYDSAIADARTRGSLRGYATASGWRAGVRLRRGNVAGALADARAAADAHGPRGLELNRPVAVAFLVEALIEQGELAEAESALADHGLSGPVVDMVVAPFLLYARGRLHAARHRHEEALRDFRECGRREEAWGVRTLALTYWRADAALAAAALGAHDEAVDLADEQLALAREHDTPRAIGAALRVRALADPSLSADERAAALTEAADVLAESGARLEEARTLLALGSTLRGNGTRREARGPLEEALSVARSARATALAAAAHNELERSGVKLRKMLVGGVDALTPSERRIAELAAGGMRNRDIAEALFVTVKTVETHLSRAYRKLDVTSREDLGRVLATGTDGASASG